MTPLGCCQVFLALFPMQKRTPNVTVEVLSLFGVVVQFDTRIDLADLPQRDSCACGRIDTVGWIERDLDPAPELWIIAEHASHARQVATFDIVCGHAIPLETQVALAWARVWNSHSRS
ncbi:MAG: hypothetical protein ACRYF5_06160 [Janthinobacterium lividum]